MLDISDTIIPKSDQLNADDLIAKDMLLTITGVKKMNSPDQPIAIEYEGGKGKPYKPCKSMRRVLIMLWGNDGEQYIGRKLLVYNDKNVSFGGKEIGGIRIKAMSDIQRDANLMLTVARGRKGAYTVSKLETESKKTATESEINEFDFDFGQCSCMADLQMVTKKIKECNYDEESKAKIMVFYNRAKDAINNPI